MKRLILSIALFLSLLAVNAQPFESYVYKSNGLGYGALYNWWAATDARGFVSGWHVPTKTEKETLVTYLGGFDTGEGDKLKETGLTYWVSPNTGATNEFGFNARGSGIRNTNGINTAFFNDMKVNFIVWTSTAINATNSYGFQCHSSVSNISLTNAPNKIGQAIRLIKDDSTDPGTVTIDGDVYNTVTIGTQVWLASNLKATHYANGDPITNVTDNTAWSLLVTGAYCWYGNDIGNK